MVVFNPFRIAGDLVHLASFIILLEKIRGHRSCAGISLKTQLLYALVFTTRYLDLFFNFFYIYNTIMKIVYLAATYYIVYLIHRKHRSSYDRDHDSFELLYLIIPALVLAVILTSEYSVFEILWTFSIVLESVSILPQIFMLQQTGEVENLTAHYIVCIGAYRALYILNWVYRFLTEEHYSAWVVWLFGTIQTVLYCDFFYYYAVSRWQGKKLVLPQ